MKVPSELEKLNEFFLLEIADRFVSAVRFNYSPYIPTKLEGLVKKGEVIKRGVAVEQVIGI